MKRIFFCLIPLVAAVGASVFYFSLTRENAERQPPQVPAPVPPAIRYPIEAGGPPTEPLPALTESDDAMRDALAALFGKDLGTFLNLQDIIRRIVATIDNLPRDHVPLVLLTVKRVPGLLVTTGTGENLALSPRNDARYRSYVRLAAQCRLRRWWRCTGGFIRSFKTSMKTLGHPISILTIGSWR